MLKVIKSSTTIYLAAKDGGRFSCPLKTLHNMTRLRFYEL